MVRWMMAAGCAISLVIGVACSSSKNNGSGGDQTSTPGSGDPSTGETIVNNYGCKSCHGDDMAGQTTPIPVQGSKIPCLALYPPNLTPDKDTGVGIWSDDQLRGAIVDGVDNEGESLCPQMKHYKDAGADDVTNMIAYLRSIKAVSKKIPTSVCPPLKGSCQ